MSSLTFNQLRAANIKRIPQYKQKNGERTHAFDDGSDWLLSQWCNATLGELGEAANIIKKIDRGDFPLAEVRIDLGKELADTMTYLDILAFRAGIDLGAATISKWNEISARIGSDLRLSDGEESDLLCSAIVQANVLAVQGVMPGRIVIDSSVLSILVNAAQKYLARSV